MYSNWIFRILDKHQPMIEFSLLYPIITSNLRLPISINRNNAATIVRTVTRFFSFSIFYQTPTNGPTYTGYNLPSLNGLNL